MCPSVVSLKMMRVTSSSEPGVRTCVCVHVRVQRRELELGSRRQGASVCSHFMLMEKIISLQGYK